MRSKAYLVTSLMLLAVFLGSTVAACDSPSCGPQSGDEDIVQLTVAVKNKLGNPVIGADIYLFPVRGPAVGSLTSNNQGEATFFVTTDSAYRIQVDKGGYKSGYMSVTVPTTVESDRVFQPIYLDPNSVSSGQLGSRAGGSVYDYTYISLRTSYTRTPTRISPGRTPVSSSGRRYVVYSFTPTRSSANSVVPRQPTSTRPTTTLYYTRTNWFGSSALYYTRTR